MCVLCCPLTILYSGTCHMNLTSLLSTLVTHKTVAGNPTAFTDLFAWIDSELAHLPLTTHNYTVNGYPARVMTTGKTTHARVWLAAHVDVVPGADRLFRPVIRGEKLYGRGAFDMKFAVACYLRLLTDIGSRLPEFDLGCILTSDEELGGDSAVQWLLEKEKYTGDVVFLPDGVGSWQFEEAAKGMLELEVTTHGERAHGSRPWLGRSAIHELCSYLHEVVTRCGVFSQPDDTAHWHTTIHVGTIRGGEAYNTVAPEAVATLDIRYTTPEEFHTLQTILATVRDTHPHTSVHIVRHYTPYGVPRDNAYADVFHRLALGAGRTCTWAKAHGCSDARFFAQAGIPTVLIAPYGGDGHSDHEWIDLADLDTYYHILRAFVDTTAHKDSILVT